MKNLSATFGISDWSRVVGLASLLLSSSASVTAQTDPSSAPETSAAGTSQPPLAFNSPDGEGDSLLLFGSPDSEATGEPIPPPEEWSETEDEDRAEFDFAQGISGGRVLYVNSGDTENTFQMVDGDAETYYEFEDTEGEAFFVVSLAEAYPIYRASITAKNAISRVQMWAFDKDPEVFFNSEAGVSESGSGWNVMRRAPTGQIEVLESETLMSLTIEIPETNARYLLVRVVAKNPSEPIEISRFRAIGSVPREYLGIRNDRSLGENQSEAPEPPPDVPDIPPASP